MAQWTEAKRSRIIQVYADGLAATKIAVDQRTAQAVDTGQPDHAIRLQAAERVLDRVFGKATVRTELTGGLTLAALQAEGPQAMTNTRLAEGD
jgi:predicted PhzF superfamily epimerase YddE/YHI9